MTADRYFNNTPLITSPGLFYDHVSKVNYYDNAWKLVVHVDLNSIESKLNFIDNTKSKTKVLCSHQNLETFNLCDTSLKILETLIPSLHIRFQSLTHLIGNQRIKRGFVDGLGSMFNVVFGTLDHSDGEYYNKAIDSLTQDKQQQMNLLREQTQVVKTTISNFNTTITNLKENTKILNNNLKVIELLTKDIEIQLVNLELKQNIDEHLSLLTLMVTESDKELLNLISAILLINNNVIHPDIISPNQFISELRTTLVYIPDGTKYIAPLEIGHYPELSQTASINGFHYKSRLIFVIYIPLIKEIDFDLYNIIPLPIVANNNSHIFILPSFKSIALSENRLQYTTMKDVSACIKLSREVLVCKLDSTLYSTHVKSIGEVELLNQLVSIPKSCDTRMSTIDDEVWHRLHNRNSWIYISPKLISVTITCRNSKPFDVHITKTGILTLSKICRGYTSTTVLNTYSIAKESIYLSLLPTFDIIADTCCNKVNHINVTLPKLEQLHNNLDVENLEIASHKLDEIVKLSENYGEDKSTIQKLVNNNYLVVVIFTLLKILVLYLLYKAFMHLKGKCNRNNDTNCCESITNCLTFNIFKSNKENVSSELRTNDIEISEIGENSSLRRSNRIAKLKEKL